MIAVLSRVDETNTVSAETAEAIDQLGQQLAIGLSSDLLVQLRVALQERTNVTIDQMWLINSIGYLTRRARTG